MTIQLRKASFRKWLRGQEPRAVVGRPQRAHDCPIARYLRHLGVARASVTRYDYWQDGTGRRTAKTPPWAARFIWDADSEARLTAATCLRILERTP